ncbi:WcaF family extracellular polysaccharide biosynthesis acetyltransferase [Pedobacter sp. GSP4]|uniref:WcaF family extracellular polysaccharide biosynthesis acetyltransferase n=1 Tax=Pedobacter sp. GSP4 TaxID=3453716 RepID=UPI003EEF80B9
MLKTQLRKDFDTGSFSVGAGIVKQFLWYFTDVFFFKSRIMPISAVLVFLLRLFGAKIGREVRLKPGIHVKYPWKLEIGNYSWLAECYIDNLDWVKVGEHCCISQQAILITGNHNYKLSGFDLITAPIVLEDGAWVGAGAQVGPGVTLHSHSVLTIGSVATKNLLAYGIYQGHPAAKIKERVLDA